MPDTTGRVRAKGCEETGITEELATKLLKAKMGKRILAVVELQTVERHGPSIDGKQRVDMVLTQIEPALDDRTEDTLRELTRAMSRQRRAVSGELPLDNTDGTAPSLDDVNQQAQAIIERDEDGKVTGIWDGDPESAISEQTPWGGDAQRCPAKDCILPEDHDGDHEPEVPEQATENDGDGNVVAFSGKG